MPNNPIAIYMQRCLELAALGLGNTAPNPLVGAVIVHNDIIIGEGYHQIYGESHAEVNAINSVPTDKKDLLQEATLYVNLEPCSHFGKTPPCADLIIQNKIPKVVIGCRDINPLVSGKGIEKLKNAGCEVVEDILQKDCEFINRRFFTYFSQQRPYIILKWAQTPDGYISKKDKQAWITNTLVKKLVHKWRSEEAAIMVGYNTALMDNPQLNIREWEGNAPLRIVIDRNLKLPHHLYLFNRLSPTLVLNSVKIESENNLEFIKVDFDNNLEEQVLKILFEKQIQSVIIEGGAKLLTSFIQKGLWDEALVFTGNQNWGEGIKAPEISGKIISKEMIGDNEMIVLMPY